jgi:hypothetical protein
MLMCPPEDVLARLFRLLSTPLWHITNVYGLRTVSSGHRYCCCVDLVPRPHPALQVVDCAIAITYFLYSDLLYDVMKILGVLTRDGSAVSHTRRTMASCIRQTLQLVMLRRDCQYVPLPREEVARLKLPPRVLEGSGAGMAYRRSHIIAGYVPGPSIRRCLAPHSSSR